MKDWFTRSCLLAIVLLLLANLLVNTPRVAAQGPTRVYKIRRIPPELMSHTFEPRPLDISGRIVSVFCSSDHWCYAVTE